MAKSTLFRIAEVNRAFTADAVHAVTTRSGRLEIHLADGAVLSARKYTAAELVGVLNGYATEPFIALESRGIGVAPLYLNPGQILGVELAQPHLVVHFAGGRTTQFAGFTAAALETALQTAGHLFADVQPSRAPAIRSEPSSNAGHADSYEQARSRMPGRV